MFGPVTLHDASVRKAFSFFHENAGGIVGQRAIGAASLARAEETLSRAQYLDAARVRWEFDPYADLSWMTDSEREESHECEGCIIEVSRDGGETWEHAASLLGIVDASRDYRRIVEAELASEAFDTLSELVDRQSA